MKKKLSMVLFAIVLALSLVFAVGVMSACGEPADDDSDKKPPIVVDPGDPGDGDDDDDDDGNSSLRDEIGPNAKEYKFEAECATISGTNEMCYAGKEAMVPENKQPSGDMYVMQIDRDGSVTITFDIWADKAGPAVLGMCMGKSDNEVNISHMFIFEINGNVKTPNPPVIYEPFTEVKYYDWTEKDIMKIDLVEGKNTIQFHKNQEGSVGLNFDYIELYTESKVEWQSEKESGKHYYKWEITEPTEEAVGSAKGYCTTCRDYQDIVLPVLSEANGYTKTANGNEITWTYEVEGVDTFTFTTYLFSKDVKFECESMALEGQNPNNPDDKVKVNAEGNNPSGGFAVGGMNSNTGSITLTVNTNKDTTVSFWFCIGRNSYEYAFNNTHTLVVNGETATVSSDVVITRCNGNEWVDWTLFEIADIELKAGQQNTIKVQNTSPNPGVINSAPSGNFDYFMLRVFDEEVELTQVTEGEQA